MCYLVVLGTDSPVDLSRHDGGRVAFSRDVPGPVAGLLTLPHGWFVSVGSCSCGLRHLHRDSVGLGFGEPVAWFPEDDEDLEATRHVAQVIRRLLIEGAAVECIDIWQGSAAPERPLETLVVNLRSVSDAEFRFFEGYRFVFVEDLEE